MSDLQREALKKRIGIPPLPSMAGKPKSAGGLRRKRDYTPLSCDEFFDRKDDIKVNGTDTFRVYRSGDQGPLLLLLHGGGHSALSWAVFTQAVTKLCTCQVLAFDMRGHGDTYTQDCADLSADTLSKDVGDLISTIYGETPPPILLIGHSMGGAIAVHVGVQNLLPTLVGLAVIDVVEGTAMDALSSMQNFLKSRPQTFKSLEQGIEWSVRSGQIHNVQSAKISMVGQLKKCGDISKESVKVEEPPPAAHTISAIQEEDEEESVKLQENQETSKTSNTVQQETSSKETEGTSEGKQETSSKTSTDTAQEKSEVWKWRIDLSKTEKFWEGWFVDMSKLFLSCKVPKLLLLAGIDRLDRELTIGQMQGKFEMQILSRCGHCVHEDAPDQVAEVIVAFLVRFKLTQAKSCFERHMPSC